jgi:hypothetical protein
MAMKIPPAPARSCSWAAAQSLRPAGREQEACSAAGSTGWMLVNRNLSTERGPTACGASPATTGPTAATVRSSATRIRASWRETAGLPKRGRRPSSTGPSSPPATAAPSRTRSSKPPAYIANSSSTARRTTRIRRRHRVDREAVAAIAAAQASALGPIKKCPLRSRIQLPIRPRAAARNPSVATIPSTCPPSAAKVKRNVPRRRSSGSPARSTRSVPTTYPARSRSQNAESSRAHQ